MNSLIYETIDSGYFLNLLKRAWPSYDLQFNEEDYYYYENFLIDFCNNNKPFDFSKSEVSSICSFIKSSIFSFVNLSIINGVIDEYTLKSINYLNVFIEFLAIYGHNSIVTSFFIETMNNLLLFPLDKNYEDKDIELLFDFYEKTNIFNNLCTFSVRYCQTRLSDELITKFLLLLRKRKQETIFCLCLYPLNSSYIRSNFKFYPEECSTRELFYGISSGYFPLTSKSHTLKVLLNMCDAAPDNIIHEASFDNPIYVLWNVSSSANGISLLNYRQYVERLFYR